MKNNSKFRLIELTQAREKIIEEGYQDLNEDDWAELSFLSRQIRELTPCPSNRIRNYLFNKV